MFFGTKKRRVRKLKQKAEELDRLQEVEAKSVSNEARIRTLELREKKREFLRKIGWIVLIVKFLISIIDDFGVLDWASEFVGIGEDVHDNLDFQSVVAAIEKLGWEDLANKVAAISAASDVLTKVLDVDEKSLASLSKSDLSSLETEIDQCIQSLAGIS